MEGIELQVHAVVFAFCACFVFLTASLYAGRYAIPKIAPPESKGKVRVEGFGLVDLAGISLFMMFYAGGLFVKGKDPDLSVGTMVLALFFQGGMAAFVVALLVWRINVFELWGIRWSRWWPVLLAVPTVFVMWAFMAVLEQVGYNAWIMELVGGDTTQEMVTAIREESNMLALGMMALVAVVGAPISEEVIFRGYIYPAMKRFSGAPAGIIVSGLLFAAVHFNLGALLPLFILGMILAALYEVTGSLWMPIAVHFVFNLGTVVVQFLMRVRPELFEDAEAAGEAAMWWPW